MNQEKRINVFNKESGMLMRTTVSTALGFADQGFTHTSKSKLKSFLNKQRKLSNNTITLKNLGIDIEKPTPKEKYFKMPSGKIHISINTRKDGNNIIRTYFPRHLVVRF